MVSVRDLAPLCVQTRARRDERERAVMANQMLSVGRTIWDWAIPLGLAVVNPSTGQDFDILRPRACAAWPSWVVDHVRAHAWPDLVRMVRLAS